MNAPITENTTRPPLAEAQQTQLFTDALAELAAGLGLVPAAVSGSTKRRGLVRVSALTAAVAAVRGIPGRPNTPLCTCNGVTAFLPGITEHAETSFIPDPRAHSWELPEPITLAAVRAAAREAGYERVPTTDLTPGTVAFTGNGLYLITTQSLEHDEPGTIYGHAAPQSVLAKSFPWPA